jgi:hypothetical protein
MSTAHRIRARNVRSGVLIVSDAAMLTLSDAQHLFRIGSQERGAWWVSYDIELSFLPISRARPAPSATQLSSARGPRPARRHVHAAWESAEVVTQAPWQANFAVTSDRPEAGETGKPDSLSGED